MSKLKTLSLFFFFLFYNIFSIDVRNYHEIVKNVEKNLSFEELCVFKKIFHGTPTEELSKKLFELFLCQYLLEKYPPQDHVICSLGGSPSIFIPILQFLEPKHWCDFRHIAFSGDWFIYDEKDNDVKMNPSFITLRKNVKEPQKSAIIAYRNYLESIGITPESLVYGDKTYVVLECIGKGRGLLSFATILFDWIKEVYPSVDKKEIKIKFFCFPQYPSNWGSPQMKNFTIHAQSESETMKVEGELFQTASGIRDGVYAAMLDESHTLGERMEDRLTPPFKSYKWDQYDPHSFTISTKVQKLIYALYVMIVHPQQNSSGDNIYLETIKKDALVKTESLKLLLMNGEFNLAFKVLKLRYFIKSKL